METSPSGSRLRAWGACLALLLAFACASAAERVSVIPQPASVVERPGEFVFTERTRIVAAASLNGLAVELRNTLRPAISFPLPPANITRSGDVSLALDPALARLGPEGYRLEIDATGLRIRAFAPAGVFYAMQTVRQLLPLQGPRWVVPAAVIEDRPRFAWRGAHLDVARHFMPKEMVLRFLDLMALHKLNTFHWHLTDDQGWRIEIRKYPLLTQVGGKTDYTTFQAGQPGQPVEGPRGGFYTQQDIREVVRYAAMRFITVVPEIEMPGHAAAAIAAYPELGNRWRMAPGGGGTSPRETEFNAEESTLVFLECVFDEVLRLFPGKVIHAGGDEVYVKAWEDNPRIRERLRELGLKNAHELQGWFTQRIGRFLASRGRRMAGWDEINNTGPAQDVVVLAWRGIAPAIAAVRAGRNAVMAPAEFTYLDTYQWIVPRAEPYTKDGFVPIEKVYGFEPVPPGLQADEAARILGAQAQLWTEFISNPRQLDYAAWPRLAALAEVVWSPREARDLAQFVVRLKPHLDRLGALGVRYRLLSLVPPPAARWKAGDAIEQATVHEWPVAPDAGGRYEVAFVKTGGAGRTLIEWVELREDGKVLQRVARPGTTDWRLHANDYPLQLPAYHARSRYSIRAAIAGLGGTDSSGEVYFLRAGTSAASASSRLAPQTHLVGEAFGRVQGIR